MAKRILCHSLLMAVAAMLLAACADKAGHGPVYELEGKAEGLGSGDRLFITDASGRVRATIIVNDGAFRYTGAADSVGLYFLHVQKDNTDSVPFINEQGIINVILDVEDLQRSVVEGTAVNDSLQKLRDDTLPFFEKIEQLEQMHRGATPLDPEMEWAVNERIRQLANEIYRRVEEAARNNASNVLGTILMSNSSARHL